MNHESITQFQEDISEPIALNELGLHLRDNDGTVAHFLSPANGISKAEKSPDYYRTIAYLNADWRLILCRSGIQWIIQKRKRGQVADRWQGRWYVKTKEGLLRGLSDPGLRIQSYGEINEAALRRIHELPDRCVE